MVTVDDQAASQPPSLFLSHAGVDSDAAIDLKTRLESHAVAQNAGLKVWLDKDDLSPGGTWQSQIERAIGNSIAFALLLGTRGVVNWVEMEVRLALDRAATDKTYSFIPIFAAGPEQLSLLPPFARQFQGVAPTELEKILRAVLDRAGDSGRAERTYETDPFFPLAPIDEDRSHLFFGRATETEKLLELVSSKALVLVSGDSGSGKSSLVRAGLLPRFRGGATAQSELRRPTDTWHALVTRPRARPWQALGDTVMKAAKEMKLSAEDCATWAERARSGKDFDAVRDGLLCGQSADTTRTLLVIDQFEELWTQATKADRHRFIELLLDLTDSEDSRFRVVLTMRHDYANLISEPGLEHLHERLEADGRAARFVLPAMSHDDLRSVVREPFLRTELAEDPGIGKQLDTLADEVLRDVGHSPGNLALVQVALSETWKQVRSDRHLSLVEAYIDSGRTEGALAKLAKEARTAIPEDQRETLDNALMRLVQLGAGGGTTRRTAKREEFSAEAWALLQRLATKRLVMIGGSTDDPDGGENAVRSHDSDTAEDDGLTGRNSPPNGHMVPSTTDQSVELSHEVIVTAWEHFQSLLHTSAEAKRSLDKVIPRAEEWLADNRTRKRFATGADLEVFRDLAREHGGWLSPDEKAFIKASTRWHRSKRIAWAGSGLALTGLTLFSLNSAHNETLAKNRAQAREIAAQAKAQSTADPELGLLLAREAHKFLSDEHSERALRERSIESKVRALLRHSGPVGYACFSPDGTKVLTISGDTVRIWGAKHGRLLSEIEHDSPVTAAAISADNSAVAIADGDGVLQLWSSNHSAADETPASWTKEVESTAHTRKIYAVAFSPASKTLLATASADGFARLLQWENDTLEETRQLDHEHSYLVADGHYEDFRWAVKSLAFSSDGKRLTTASGSVIFVWDVAEGQLVREPELPEPLEKLDVGIRDGHTVVAAAGGTRIQVLDLDKISGEMPGDEIVAWDDLIPRSMPVLTAAIDATGRLLATSQNENTVDLLWMPARNRYLELGKLAGHAGIVPAIDFDNGLSVVTASADATARIWTVDPKMFAPLSDRLGPEIPSTKVVFDRAGTLLAIASRDTSVYLFEVGSMRPLLAPTAPSGPATAVRLNDGAFVNDIVFSRDGNLLATALGNGKVQLWNVRTATHRGDAIWIPGEPALKVAFDPTGDRLLVAAKTHALVWEVSSGTEIGSRLAFDTPPLNASFSHSGKQIITVHGSGIRVWDAETGDAIGSTGTQDSIPIRGGVFNENWTALATFDGTHVEVRKLPIDSVANPGVWLRKPAKSGALSADGERLAALGDDTIEVWDMPNQKLIANFNIARGVTVSFDRDARRLAAGDETGSVSVWDMNQVTRVASFKADQQALTRLAFSPDGSRLLTTSASGVRLHREERFLDIESLKRLVEKRVTRELSQEERLRYLPGAGS